MHSINQQVYLLQDYRKWLNHYWRKNRQAIPEDLRFESHDPVACP